LYAHLNAAQPDAEGREAMEESARKHNAEPPPRPEVIWNFEKFLVSREGEVVARFAPGIEPDAPELVEAIESALH
jgi:glutathione peroxidase